MIAAIVLAAGASSRMGSPKALLVDRAGRPFVVRLVRTLRDAGLDHVVVVTGTHHEAITAALRADDRAAAARVVRNAEPARGQLSSLWVGLDALAQPEPEAVLMTLVDVPFVAAATVRAVIEAWRQGGAPIVRPAIGDRHGHPVLFDRAVIGELRRAPLDGGAKTVVHAHQDDLQNVAVTDAGAVTDIDTPADYAEVVRRLG